VVLVYGVFCILGGILGYVKAKSLPSLIAGATSGAALLLFGYGMLQGSRAAGFGILIVALSLGVRFLGTWRQTHRLMPDLLMVLMSAATLVTVAATLVGR